MNQFSPQLTQNTAYLHIEDQLDAMGQKYRGMRILRGGILWIASAIVSSWAAALVAHFIGDASTSHSGWNWIVLMIWIGLMSAATIVWVIRPLLIRPGIVQMARLLESRVDGLHNGLTNSVLLAQANDLQASPWLPQIFSEIQKTLSAQPIGDAVKMSDLNAVAFRAGLVITRCWSSRCSSLGRSPTVGSRCCIQQRSSPESDRCRLRKCNRAMSRWWPGNRWRLRSPPRGRRRLKLNNFLMMAPRRPRYRPRPPMTACDTPTGPITLRSQ